MLPEGIIRVTNSILITHFLITNHKVSLLFNLKKNSSTKIFVCFSMQTLETEKYPS